MAKVVPDNLFAFPPVASDIPVSRDTCKSYTSSLAVIGGRATQEQLPRSGSFVSLENGITILKAHAWQLHASGHAEGISN